MNLFIELRRHARLAERRSPMYDKSRFAKFWTYLFVVFWAGYLIFFGALFAFGLQDEAVEPYHLINAGLLVFMGIDFLIRLAVQTPPTQEVKPYMLLPVPRMRLIDMLLLRSALHGYNLFWLFFFVPFGLFSIARFYGLWGVFTYSVGIWLLMLINNYWYLLCRTLMSCRFVWLALPVAVYAALGCAIFLPSDSPLLDWSVSVGEGYLRSNPLTFAGTLAVIAVFYLLCRAVVSRSVYSEVNRVEDTTVRVKRVSDYSFFDRYGIVGEYMKLELKMLLRNKVCRSQLYIVAGVVLMFSVLMAFTDVYEGGMTDFLVMYNFVVFSLFLTSIMGYEGNYIDGLMSRKESILQLLQAKYYVYALGQVIPLLLLIPAMVMGKVGLLTCVGWMVFVQGAVFCTIFQLAVYNNTTIPLNAKTTQRNMGTGMQNLISALAMGMPLMLHFSFKAFLTPEQTALVFILIGMAFIATHKLWMCHVYSRFMRRRYANMEGLRNSRQK